MDIFIKVKTIVDDISEKMPDQFNMHDIMAKCEERTPYIIVCFQVKYHPRVAQILVVSFDSNSLCIVNLQSSRKCFNSLPVQVFF